MLWFDSKQLEVRSQANPNSLDISKKDETGFQKGFHRFPEVCCTVLHYVSQMSSCDSDLRLVHLNLSTLWALRMWLYAAWLSPESWNDSAHSLRKGNWLTEINWRVQKSGVATLVDGQAGPLMHSHTIPSLKVWGLNKATGCNRLQEKIASSSRPMQISSCPTLWPDCDKQWQTHQTHQTQTKTQCNHATCCNIVN